MRAGVVTRVSKEGALYGWIVDLDIELRQNAIETDLQAIQEEGSLGWRGESTFAAEHMGTHLADAADDFGHIDAFNSVG